MKGVLTFVKDVIKGMMLTSSSSSSGKRKRSTSSFDSPDGGGKGEPSIKPYYPSDQDVATLLLPSAEGESSSPKDEDEPSFTKEEGGDVVIGKGSSTSLSPLQVLAETMTGNAHPPSSMSPFDASCVDLDEEGKMVSSVCKGYIPI